MCIIRYKGICLPKQPLYVLRATYQQVAGHHWLMGIENKSLVILFFLASVPSLGFL